MTVSVDDIAKQMLALLPDDGTPVLNKDLRVLLNRTLAEWIDDENYITARVQLIEQNLIALKRGHGGQVFRLPKLASRKADNLRPTDTWSEADLMPCLEKYLRGPFLTSSNHTKGATCLTYDTSTAGPKGIRWARPDFTLISVRKFRFLSGAEIDVHSFELKAEFGGDDLAVFEALAQTRFTHFGYLVWHLPKQSRSERRLSDIQKQCGQRGIGFIRFQEPEDFETWEILVEPIKQSTPPAEIDLFLYERLTEANRREILKIVDGGGL